MLMYTSKDILTQSVTELHFPLLQFPVDQSGIHPNDITFRADK